ncbi:MAG: peptide deformylase [Bacteroidota bacterium]
MIKRLKLFSILLLFASSIFLFENCVKKDIDYLSNKPGRVPHDSDNPNDTIPFTDEEIQLIMDGDSADLMRVLKIHTIVGTDTITNYEDSVNLRRTAINVIPDSNDIVLQRLIDRMYTTVNDSLNPGVGIAAPQVGINRNIIWVQRLDKTNKPFEVYLNPKIIAYSNKKIIFMWDGCLSIPGISGKTDRYSAVCVEYDLLDGTHHTEVVEGYSSLNFTSVIFQHEIDHLLGVLFIDRIHVYSKIMSEEQFDIFEQTMEKGN